MIAVALIGSAGPAVAAWPWHDAIALWHMADLEDSAGKESTCALRGEAKLGVALKRAEREASLRRGGDGLMADLRSGWLDAGQGAGGELNLRGGALSLYVRMRSPAGDWRGHGILSKYGGHDRLVYNLYANGGDLGFELGTATGLYRVTVPAADIGPTDWHDVIARYDGRKLQLFVDGVRRSQVRAEGPLREGNAEPTLLGAYSLDGRVHGPAPCWIDTAALWARPLTDDDIARLSGVERIELKVAAAARFGLKTRVSGDGREFIPAWLEASAGRFGAGGHGGPLDRPSGHEITLHVFVDRSILEVYVDGHACTARMFPDAKALGVDLFAEGGEVLVRSVDVWEMRTMWGP